MNHHATKFMQHVIVALRNWSFSGKAFETKNDSGYCETDSRQVAKSGPGVKIFDLHRQYSGRKTKLLLLWLQEKGKCWLFQAHPFLLHGAFRYPRTQSLADNPAHYQTMLFLHYCLNRTFVQSGARQDPIIFEYLNTQCNTYNTILVCQYSVTISNTYNNPSQYAILSNSGQYLQFGIVRLWNIAILNWVLKQISIQYQYNIP